MLNILKNLKRKRKKKNSFVHRGTVITIGVIAAVAALVYFYVEKKESDPPC